MGKRELPKPPIPAIGEAKRGVGGHLIYLLRQANAVTRLALDRALADQNVTFPQFSVMTMIASYPDLSSADLARLTLQTPQTVNVVVRSLERRGAIRRLHDRVHGQILRLEMTPEGRQLLARCRTRSDRVETMLHTALSKAEEAGVRRWLVRVALGLTDDKRA